MAQIEARVYRLTERSRWLFETIFPDMEDKDEAQFILISSAGTTTFRELPPTTPGSFNIPHMEIHSYYELTFEDE